MGACEKSSSSLSVGTATQITRDAGIEVHPSISPDGKMIAYAAGPWSKSRIYVKQLGRGGEAVAMTDTAYGAQWPRFSPDGNRILYTANDRTYIVKTAGGPAVPFGGNRKLTFCNWSNDGEKVACTDFQTRALVVLGHNGENARDLGPVATAAIAPSFSPDDKLIAFVRNGHGFLDFTDIVGEVALSSIWVIPVEGGAALRVTDETHLNTSPAWTPDGKLLYVSSLNGGRDVYSQQISSDLKTSREPVRLTTGLNAHTISLRRDGRTLAYSVFNTNANLWRTPIPGAAVESPPLEQITSGNQAIKIGNVSPDGKWIVYDSNVSGTRQIYRMRVGGGQSQEITHGANDSFSPSWSPDGAEIVFNSVVNGDNNIYVVSAAGGEPVFLASTSAQEPAPRWNGRNSIYYLVGRDSIFGVSRTATDAAWEKPRLLWNGPVAKISPDGTQAFVVVASQVICGDCPGGPYWVRLDKSAHREVDLGEILKVIRNPGEVAWSADSRHAYFAMREMDGTSSVWQLAVNGDTTRRLIHFTDPSRQFYQTSISVDKDHIYFTLGDRQSDIWTMEMSRQ